MSEDSFITIPTSLLSRKDLQASDKLVFSIIYGFKLKVCWASNEYISEHTGLSIATVKRSIKLLEDKKIISKSITQEGPFIKRRVIEINNFSGFPPEGQNEPPRAQNEPVEAQNEPYQRVKMSPTEAQNEPSIDNIINKRKDKRIDKKKPPKEITILEVFDLPDNINTKEVRDMIDTWLQYKKERKESYLPTGFKMFIKKLQKSFQDPESLIASLENAMSNNWQGFFKEKTGLDRARKHLSRNDQHHEAIRTSMERVQQMRDEIAEEERTGISSGEQFGFFGGFLDMPEKE